MPKLKTHKSVAKRIRVTKTHKLMKRTAGQDHFNAREPGKITRKKRRDTEFASTNIKAIKAALPYHFSV